MINGRFARVGLLVGLLMFAPPARGGAPEPDAARLRTEVETLTSAAFLGRRDEGGRKTAEHLAEVFRGLGLAPLFDDGYLQPIPVGPDRRVQGRNVGATLRGCDPARREEWVVVSAHFDHLGVRNGVLYPGADDNASGVAMMLEVARAMALAPEKPRRSVLFLGFDLEEIGLFGSRYFVENSPIPVERIVLFLTADMIARALGGVCDSYVFVMGTEHAPELRAWIDQAARPFPLTVGLLGTDLLLLNRSDYGPFRARQVPFLFFTTGENPVYHTPRDTADSLNYPKLEAISRVIHTVIRRAAAVETVPRWTALPDNPLSEAVTLRDVLRTLLEHREALKIGAAQILLMKQTLRSLDSIIARGAITPSERSGIIRAARIVMVSVL
jgi:hypothetical protein